MRPLLITIVLAAALPLVAAPAEAAPPKERSYAVDPGVDAQHKLEILEMTARVYYVTLSESPQKAEWRRKTLVAESEFLDACRLTKRDAIDCQDLARKAQARAELAALQ